MQSRKFISLAHQQSISDFLILLYQERILITDLFEKRGHKRLFLKSELLKLCRDNSERLDKLIQGEILKPRLGRFELNQSLLESFSVLLRLPSTSDRFTHFVEELRGQVEATHQTAGKLEFLHRRKNLIRNIEESVLQALERAARSQDKNSIEKLAGEIKELQNYVWQEKGLKIYRDIELDGLIQDLGQLLQEGLNSLENILTGLQKGKSKDRLLHIKMMKLSELQRTGSLENQTNLKTLLETKHPVLLEQVETLRPRISSQQLFHKSSLVFLSKVKKKSKKR